MTPDLHPSIVHFPLVLLPLAALVEVAGWIRRRPDWERAALLLYVPGTFFAWLAVWSGDRAAARLVQPAPEIERLVAGHSELAHVAAWAFTLVTLGRLLWDRLALRLEAPRTHPLRLLLLGIALGGMVAIAVAGLRGHQMVHVHGVGTGGGMRGGVASYKLRAPPTERLCPVGRAGDSSRLAT